MFRASSAHLQEDTVVRPTENLPPQSVLTQAVYRQATKNSHRGKIEHKYCIFCSSKSYFVLEFLTTRISNYSYFNILQQERHNIRYFI